MTARSVSDLAADVTTIINAVTSRMDYERHLHDPEGMRREIEAVIVERLEAAEAQVAALTQERDRLTLGLNEWAKTARAAEAALAEAHRIQNLALRESARLREQLADTRRALEPFVENWDFHACDYLVGNFEEEMRAIPARVVDDMIEAQKVARRALAAAGGGTGQEQQP